MKTNYISKSSRTHAQVRNDLKTFLSDVCRIFEYGYGLTENRDWFIIATHDDFISCDVLCHLPEYLHGRMCVCVSLDDDKIELLFAKENFSK